jgi:hypothetical protein
LGDQLFPGHLLSSRLAGCLLCSCHFNS